MKVGGVFELNILQSVSVYRVREKSADVDAYAVPSKREHAESMADSGNEASAVGEAQNQQRKALAEVERESAVVVVVLTISCDAKNLPKYRSVIAFENYNGNTGAIHDKK